MANLAENKVTKFSADESCRARGNTTSTASKAKVQPISILLTPGKTALSFDKLALFLSKLALSLGERVARDGVLTSRRGSGEGLLSVPNKLVPLKLRTIVAHLAISPQGRRL